MPFAKHWELEGQHAYLGASKYHWINYDLEKVKKTWENQFKSRRGVRLHDLARFLIKEKIKLEKLPLTLNMYVNDAIGFRMEPEVVFKHSMNHFGTADAASWDPDRNEFRVHDLKTGLHPGHFEQLLIYCALFCFEYKKNPYNIVMIMRIYQNDQMYEQYADPREVERIISQAKLFDPEIDKMREEME